MRGPRRKRAGESGDAVRAWLYLRRVEEYRNAWRAQTAQGDPAPALEPGPFPIRIQTAADLDAGRFELLAWQDPDGAEGGSSPFWVQEGMVEAALDPGAEPLVEQVAAGGGSIEGLRLRDGCLVLKVACAGAVVQVLLRACGPFPEDGGIEIRHRFGLRMPQTVRRLLDFWSVAGLPAPPAGRVRGMRMAQWRRFWTGCGTAGSRARSPGTSGARPGSRRSGTPTGGCAPRCGAGSRRRRRWPKAAGGSWCRAPGRKSDAWRRKRPCDAGGGRRGDAHPLLSGSVESAHRNDGKAESGVPAICRQEGHGRPRAVAARILSPCAMNEG